MGDCYPHAAMRTSENTNGRSHNPDFDLQREEWIDEIQAQIRLFRHKATGAEVLSVCNQDTNKVFAITLRTPTHDSTGVAHILEHTVLCGSEKFPVKDPFKELMKGSLYTFLNAMTYSDKTVYPVASENLQDFYNLTDVYLDAVFRPQLTRQMFEQEGWHYELLGPGSELQYKGVVFNEMKGVYSSPDSVVYRSLSQRLLPDSNEGHDSGGTPAFVPDLSHEALVDYHKRYYHPSNSRIFFYGNDDEPARLERLSQALKGFEAAPVDSTIVLQPRWAEPRELRETYMPSEDEGDAGTYAIAGWMIGESNDPIRNGSLNILGYLLLGQTGSPLRKALLDSELGDDLAGYGIDTTGAQIDFTTGLRGVEDGKANEVFALIEQTLRDLCETGFSANAIESAFNTTEFHLRENNTGSNPRGLVFLLRVMHHWLFDRSPFTTLPVGPIIETIKQRVTDDPLYFQRLIQAEILDNPHRLFLQVEPDSGIAEVEEAAEKARLAAVRAGWTNGDMQACIDRSKELIAIQDAPDSPEKVASIPRLSQQDLRRDIKHIDQHLDEQDGARLVHNDLFTQDIWYLDLAFDATRVPTRLLSYIPLFGRCLTEMGTSRHNYVELAEQIGMRTGGINATCYTGTNRNNQQTQARLLIRAKVLGEKADSMIDLLEDLLLETQFDQQRFRQMLLEEKSYEESGMVPSGHRLAKTRLKARFADADWISERIDGFEYVQWLRLMHVRVEKEWEAVAADLEKLRRILITRDSLVINNTISTEGMQRLRPKLDAFIKRLPDTAEATAEWTRMELPANEALVAPAQINYVGQLVDLGHCDWTFSGAHLVINRYIRNSWLWDEVRVKGGAYGASSSIDQEQKSMLFTSYRDPNIRQTLAAYKSTARFLQTDIPTADVVEQAIIGTIGEVDSFRLPDALGYSAFIRHLLGITEEERQQARDEILGTSASCFATFGAQLEAAFNRTNTVIVGAEARVRAEGLEKDLVPELQYTPLFPPTS